METLQSGTESATLPQSEATQDQQTSRPAAIGRTVQSSADGAASIGKIGRFELKQVLGSGGFGMVYRAYDPVLGRQVALKLPHFTGEDKNKIRRFIAEAKSAAKLRHPNIVAVFDAGRTPEGQHFIASEFIDGAPLSDVIGDLDSPLDVAAKVEWVKHLALALAYAHGEGVIHRDVKPANVLLDSKHRRPQLADFGLAKQLDEKLSLQTQDGSVLGTPAYMAPEQARGDISAVGPASDQYSLGIVLYELLSGARPFPGTPHEVLVAVASPREPRDIRALARSLPDDLAAVCMKAISKRIEDRYETCGEFAADLQRWLTDQPVSARPIGSMTRFLRWTRREPVLAGLVTGVIVLSVVSTIAAFGFFAAQKVVRSALSTETELRTAAQSAASEAERERNIAQTERKTAQEERKKTADSLAKETKALADLEKEQQRVTEALAKETTARGALEQELYFSGIANVELSVFLGEAGRATQLFKPYRKSDRWEARYLSSRLAEHDTDLDVQRLTGKRISSGWPICSWEPSGKLCAIMGPGGEGIHLFDPITRELRTIAANSKVVQHSRRAKWNHDGTMLALYASDAKVRVLASSDGQELYQSPAVTSNSLAWHPEKDELLTYSRPSGGLAILAPRNGTFAVKEIIKLKDAWGLHDATWGDHIVLLERGGDDGLRLRALNPLGATVWQSTIGSTNRSATEPNACAYSPDGRWIAVSVTNTNSVHIFEGRTGKLQRTIVPDSVALKGFTWSPDSQVFATCGGSGFVTLWRVADGAPVKTILSSDFYVSQVTWSATDRLLAVEMTGKVHQWSGPKLRPSRFKYQHENLRVDPQFYWSADSQSLRISHGGLSSWNRATGEERQLALAEPEIYAGPDGKVGVKITPYGPSASLALVSGKLREQFALIDQFVTGGTQKQTIRWSSNGKYVAGSTGDKPYCCVCDASSGQRVCTLGNTKSKDDAVLAIDFSPNSDRLAVGLRGGLVIAEIPSGRVVLEDHSKTYFQFVQWSTNGKYLVTRQGGDIAVRDDSGRTVRVFTDIGGIYHAPAISPGGDLIAVLSDKIGMPQLYDVESGRQILSFHGIQGGLSMSWSPDGLLLAVACKDGYVDILEAPPPKTHVTSDKTGESRDRD